MKKLYAHWCHFNNFGDALNPYLLNKLSGSKVIYCNNTLVLKNEIRYLIRDVKAGGEFDLNRLVHPFFRRNKKVILAIGSILSDSLPNYHIWGAGFMNKNEHANGGYLYAVRGPYSAEMLYMDGFPLCEVYGDPALLLPIVFTPIKKESCDCGIIPHWKDLNYFEKKYPDKKIIDLTCGNIEEIINQITSCKYILSSSLHGIIVAHAYGIPALWIKYGDINTDGIKFKDYFASVDLPIYSGILDFDSLLSQTYLKYPQKIKDLMFPKKSISEIQKNLINNCPFNILPKFKLNN